MLIQPCEAVLKLVDKLNLGCDIPPNFQQFMGLKTWGPVNTTAISYHFPLYDRIIACPRL